MVITDELSNDTMLIQLRCKTNRKVKDRHAVEQKENKNQARKTSFVETTIYWFLTSVPKKKKRTK